MSGHRRYGSAPRIHIHADGRATLSGLHYADLRSILTAASLHHYDTEKEHKAEAAKVETEAAANEHGLGTVIRANHRDSGAWIKRIRNLLTMADAAMAASIRASHGAGRVGRLIEMSPWEVRRRLDEVRSDRRFRQSLDEMIAGMRTPTPGGLAEGER